VISLAADVLGTMSADELTPALRPVARFAANQRAKRGASAIAVALEESPAFRTRVLAAADKLYPGLVEAVRYGDPPPAAEPVGVAVVAYLLRPDGWRDLVAGAHEAEATEPTRDAAAVRLREQLDTLRAEARQSREKYKREIERVKDENRSLRQRLNTTRKQVETAEEAASGHEQQAAQADGARAEAEREVRRLRTVLAAAQEASEAARRAGKQGRDLEAAKLSLLLDTMAEAAAGLRRELALPATHVRPADDVDARAPGAETPQRRARDTDDPGHLNELLGLPKAHLVVDGYNVTKSLWAGLSLDAQRSRLVAGLRALVARTGAETTCVFDGADVAVPPPVPPTTGVRVRFSPAGETADELIRRLVGAEPVGRVVVVVSSDRELADSVRERDAYVVASGALAGLLE
jgi:predicted RNA-binding protein with PIN domain